MRSIGGRRRSDGFGRCGVISEIPLLLFWNPNRESVNPDTGQGLLGSLAGAVSSQRVTEESKGTLNAVGNRMSSVKAQGCLTARPISRAGVKAGLSDPAVS